MSFVERLINIQIDLANGVFDGGGNSATLTGLRVSSRIKVQAGSSRSSLEASIFGLPESTMNRLSTVGTQYSKQAKNTITMMAGDKDSGMAQVYKGTLFAAYVDAQAMPEVAFRVSGSSGLYEAVQPVVPTSMQGGADVAKIMEGLAGQMGLQFENNSVSTQLANPYFSGPPFMQARSAAEHAGINFLIDNGTLAIWKPGQSRQGSTLMVSKETGMVGYPMFSQPIVIVTTLFDPTIKYGGKMQVKSDLTSACGTFVISNVDLQLDAMMPGGAWFATLAGIPENVGQEVASS